MLIVDRGCVGGDDVVGAKVACWLAFVVAGFSFTADWSTSSSIMAGSGGGGGADETAAVRTGLFTSSSTDDFGTASTVTSFGGTTTATVRGCTGQLGLLLGVMLIDFKYSEGLIRVSVSEGEGNLGGINGKAICLLSRCLLT